MIGQKFGKLTVLEELHERTKHGRIVYKCKCDCGNICNVIGSCLRNGNTKSCGCLKDGHPTHNKSNTKLYKIYNSMLDRCCNKNNKRYIDYGGRGIDVCQEWKHDFEAFYNWAINNNYKEGLSIDRIDNDRNYSPDNCKWSTLKQQANNRRSNVYLTYNNKTQTIAQWAEELNINYYTIKQRHHLGYTDKECLFGRDK